MVVRIVRRWSVLLDFFTWEAGGLEARCGGVVGVASKAPLLTEVLAGLFSELVGGARDCPLTEGA